MLIVCLGTNTKSVLYSPKNDNKQIRMSSATILLSVLRVKALHTW